MKILCFGDSLTRGVSFINGRLKILKNNYPNVLQNLFNEQSNEVEIVNKGVFNDNSCLMMDRLERDVFAEKPHYVIIGVGGNDCDFPWVEVAKREQDEYEATVPLEQYRENMTTMISKIQDEGITPILSSLPPLDPVRYYNRIVQSFSSNVSDWICKVGGIEHWHSQYNRALKQVAQELDVLIIDVRTAIKRAGDLKELISDDGIHLTEKGYEVFASEIYRTVH
ncbi:SGNH/GDSL hydrolase family protein [Chungangia koreensis]|uniref:SGNH/GDSL hydrolase family protein n=1 Tax=Chungangia koreensis TaxID=752657 RepID=A0ABV8XBE3_9LACT